MSIADDKNGEPNSVTIAALQEANLWKKRRYLRMNLGRETETLEFKKSTSELKEGVISIASMLNKHQKGELYFGVIPDVAMSLKY